jgi:hypothetical protein
MPGGIVIGGTRWDLPHLRFFIHCRNHGICAVPLPWGTEPITAARRLELYLTNGGATQRC